MNKSLGLLIFSNFINAPLILCEIVHVLIQTKILIKLVLINCIILIIEIIIYIKDYHLAHSSPPY